MQYTEQNIMYNLLLDHEIETIFDNLESKYIADDILKRIYIKGLELYKKGLFTKPTFFDAVGADLKYMRMLHDEIIYILTKDDVKKVIKYLKEEYIKNHLAYNLDKMTMDEMRALLQETYTKEEAIVYKDNIDKYIAGALARDVEAIPFHLTSLNRLVGGIRKGEYVILAARPSVGKSSFLEQLFWFATALGKRVLFVSVEMSEDTVFKRQILRTTGIDLINGVVDQKRRIELYEDIKNALGNSLLITGNIHVADIEAHVKKYNPDLVIIDYLQIISHPNGRLTEYERVTQISDGLRNLRSNFPIALVAASQYNRDAASQPKLSDLRSSGQLEQDADVVLSLWTQNEYDELTGERKVYIDCLKNRNGTTFMNSNNFEVALHFKLSKVSFFDIERSLEKV